MTPLLRRIDLTSLRLFVAVCQERNIARAAERECIAPSAVSRRIAEIEAIIGLPVIQRESRGISVTPVGETVLRHAEAVIASIERMGAELSRFEEGVKGSVRVAANMSSIVQFLPEDIAAFRRAFPDIEVELDEQTSENVLRSVHELDFDLGICNRIPGIERLEHLSYRADRLFLMVPRRHRLAGHTVVRLADFVAESFVGLGDGAALSRLLARQATALGGRLDVKIRVGSLDALCRMVHVHLGVAVVPQHVGELYLNTLDVVLIPIDETWAMRELTVVFRQRERLSAAAASLADFLTTRH
ncbi:DNA-binding transcriptional LysR family regulator [Cupriavidus gilardii J11]|uniref:DNA-binding transcriptional LysR family regulator n=1 Tax=Cupriavidus gilardii J11 TaxID=936133 RepID=A0A562BU69_9BURK|nr:LysR family transcriptional regulator [Cupriavidus gilardii]TWG88469.1 DNA-binding transcriptional LysR family regulator [Cupriavidus gilardii J11]